MGAIGDTRNQLAPMSVSMAHHALQVVVLFLSAWLLCCAPRAVEAGRRNGKDIYIVQLKGQPLATRRQQPRTAAGKLDSQSLTTTTYTAYLRGQHAVKMQQLGATQADLLQSFTNTLNGFAAALTPDQVGIVIGTFSF